MHNRINIYDNAHSAMKEMLEAHIIVTKKVTVPIKSVLDNVLDLNRSEA